MKWIGRKTLNENRLDENSLDENWAHGLPHVIPVGRTFSFKFMLKIYANVLKFSNILMKNLQSHAAVTMVWKMNILVFFFNRTTDNIIKAEQKIDFINIYLYA